MKSRTTRAEQREETRERILAAARDAFSELGFKAASTRDIAARANTTQGLITYHFRTKEELWKAAVGGIFELLEQKLGARLASIQEKDPREFAREVIREYVRFTAAHPELFRLMVEQGKHDDARTRWLVKTHLRPMYENVFRDGLWAGKRNVALAPHLHYALAGAGSLPFAIAPEVRRLWGLEPSKKDFVEAHADVVAELLVP